MSNWAKIDNRPAKAIGKAMFKHEQDGSVCGMCGSDKVGYNDFSDDLSRKEFTISLMCQECQNAVFGSEEE